MSTTGIFHATAAALPPLLLLAGLQLACPAVSTGEDSGSSAADGGVGADAGATDAAARSDSATGADAAPGWDAASGQDTASGHDAAAAACTPGAGDCGAEICRPNLQSGILECQPAGSVPLGDDCGSGGTDDCVSDAVCIDMYGEGTATCRPMCTYYSSGLDCPDGEQLCAPFYGPQDVGVCVGDDCTPPAEGCAAGERCSFFMGEVLACLPAGPAGEGGDCSEDYCQAGYACVEENSDYFCRPLCSQAADCSEGYHCEWPSERVEEWGICRPGCDLLEQSGCGDGEACYYSDPELGSTLCWTEGTLPVGADCSSMLEMCVPGADCFADPESEPDWVYYCRAYCDDAHPCASGSCEVTDLMRGIGLCL